jgi:hypothetical protein
MHLGWSDRHAACSWTAGRFCFGYKSANAAETAGGSPSPRHEGPLRSLRTWQKCLKSVRARVLRVLRVLLVIQYPCSTLGVPRGALGVYQQSGPHFLHILVFAGGIGCAVGIRCGGLNDFVRVIRDTALSVHTAGAINRTLALRSQRIVLFIAIWWVAHSASGAGTSTGACSVMPAEPFADPLLSATDESNKLPLIGACTAFLGVDLPSAAAQHVPCVRRAKGRP